MKRKIQVLGLCSALVVSSAQAEIAFNGFANIVGGQTTSSDEKLYGYDDSFNFKNGSLFALQASSDLGNGLGVTAQIISRGSEDWDPDFEWAYVSYDATDELRFLVGRQRVPFYMYSDFLDVSYAYPWITPPEGVYSVPFDSFDGVGAIYSTSLGEFDTSVQFIYGGYDGEVEGTAGEFDDLMGLSLTLNRDWLTLRAGYLQANMNIAIDAEGLDSLWQGAGFPDVASHFIVEDDTGQFIEFGFQVDYENILLIGEYTQLKLDNAPLADADNNYYVMAGYRFDNILVHATYGGRDADKDAITTDVPTGVGLDPLIAGTNAVINELSEEHTYYTLGLRWDFHDSAALKFEYTSYSDDLNSTQDAGLFRTAIVSVF
jgi:hypothetical protein